MKSKIIIFIIVIIVILLASVYAWYNFGYIMYKVPILKDFFKIECAELASDTRRYNSSYSFDCNSNLVSEKSFRLYDKQNKLIYVIYFKTHLTNKSIKSNIEENWDTDLRETSSYTYYGKGSDNKEHTIPDDRVTLLKRKVRALKQCNY